MKGFKFSEYSGDPNEGASFEKLFKIFQELMLYTSGNMREALSWLTQLDKEYKLTDSDYGIADFISDLNDKGYIKQEETEGNGLVPTRKMEISIRQKSLDDIFGQLKKAKTGTHNTKNDGKGDEFTSDVRPFEFGDRWNISPFPTVCAMRRSTTASMNSNWPRMTWRSMKPITRARCAPWS